MQKKFVFILAYLLVLSNSVLFAQPVLTTADSITVDGICRNSKVVITGRNPRFSWGFTFDAGYRQYRFDLEVGTTEGGSGVWSVSKTNSSEYIIYEGSADLIVGTTYYWRVKVIDDAMPAKSSEWASSYFHTVKSAISVPADSIILFVDWNNPFSPSVGEVTKIRYGVNDGSEQLRLRVYSLNGELIVTLAEHLGLEDSLYTAEWDGRNAEGKVVSSGVYFVNLEVGDGESDIVRVVVLK